MSIKNLIEHFSTSTLLPIYVREICDYMVSGRLAIKDRIQFVGVEIDVEVLRGFLHQYTEGPIKGSMLRPMACADIYYDREQPIEWQRLVCAKNCCI